jgi:hypothetical protein
MGVGICDFGRKKLATAVNLLPSHHLMGSTTRESKFNMFRNLQDNWDFFHPRLQRWFTAQVPGSIYLDLLRHGLIEDPFWGSNEKALEWIAEETWTYRCRFPGHLGHIDAQWQNVS